MLSQTALFGLAIGYAQAVSHAVPSSLPSNASPKLIEAPIGVSIEFFAFPGYMDVPSTEQCLKNFQDLTGTWPPMRIGGTTQDRALYNASLSKEVDYYVADPKDAPVSVRYGPSFITLADKYNGSVIFGLNRRLNQLNNTISAAKNAVANISNLIAIELANEPNFFNSTDPINTNGGNWTASDDIASQTSWQSSVGTALNKTDVFSAGVYFSTQDFSIVNLSKAETSSGSIKYVSDFCSHNYPQSQSTANLPQLMNHSAIHHQISPYAPEIAASHAVGRTHIMGETNSATQGGGGISPMFGSALWVMDYSLQLLYMGSERIYFHQGTIGNCPYCWWNGTNNIGSPYYGAYFATLALANASYVAPLDDFGSLFGAWAVYGESEKVEKVLLYNSGIWNGTAQEGSRPEEVFELEGLDGCVNKTLKAVRLTAPSALSRQYLGENPSVGGQMFANSTCEMLGEQKMESAVVGDDGKK
ncbi:Beta-glucuronidase, partial [Pseudocercospora fuligena]